MVRVINNLNQPLTIDDDRSVGAYGDFTVRSVDDNLQRLADIGQVTLVEEVAEKPTTPTATVASADTDKAKGEKK